jgi:hypothetical protein
MPRVFIVNKSGHDYKPAEKWGDLYPLTEGTVHPLQTDRIRKLIEGALSCSIKQDYLLLSGAPILNALAAVEFYRKHGLVNYLVYDAKQHNYVLREVHIDTGLC